MRRITLAFVSTLAVLVLLFSYKTSRDESVVTVQAVAPAEVPTGSTIVTGVTSAVGATGAAGASATAAPATTSAQPSRAATSSSGVTRARVASSSGAARTTTASSAVTTAVPSTTSSSPQVVTGGAADTPYGPVQVQITVQDGKITAATAVEYPQESRRDAEINSYAIPQLQAETLAAQSSHIQGVGGATFTSNGFAQSLQSAIDAAHLG